MKKICYATDCSRYSAPALRYAYRLSNALGAHLHVVHIYTLPPIATATIWPYEKLLRKTRKEQREVVSAYCDRHLGYESQGSPILIEVMENSSIATGICTICDEVAPDLLIVGEKDAKTLRGFFAGNIADELLGTIDVPLLILPNDTFYHGLSTMVYATDFEESDVYAIRDLVKIAEPFGALIKVVHIPRRKEMDLQHHMAWFELEVRQRVHYPEISFALLSAEDIASGLLSFVQKEKADMLVMMERKHSDFLDRFFCKDMVKTMEVRTTIPLLAYNKKSICLKIMEEGTLSYSFA